MKLKSLQWIVSGLFVFASFSANAEICEFELLDDSPSTWRELGNILHQDWQEGTAYRARPKVVKDPNGVSFRNFEDYEAWRNTNGRPIRDRYRYFYRVNPVKKVLEEDIVQLPNPELAPNNAAENSAGARSYVLNLAKMLRHEPVTLEAALRELAQMLQQVHHEWFQRNISWTKGNVSEIFAETDIQTRFNATHLAFKLAKRFNALQSHIWSQAFQYQMGLLAKEKYDYLETLDVEEAYLAAARQQGSRPRISTDIYLQEIFHSKLKEFESAEAQVSSNTVEGFVKRHLLEAIGVQPESIQIKAPPVAPGTSAQVYILSGKNGPKAALKVQRGIEGLEEIVATAATNQLLEGLTQGKSIRPVRTLTLGRITPSKNLEETQYFVLQEIARDYEAELLFQGNPEPRLRMIQTLGKALAELHGPAIPISEADQKKLKADLGIFVANAIYDVMTQRRFEIGGPLDLFTPLIEKGIIDAQTADELNQRMNTISRLYETHVEQRPASFFPTHVHGDAHGGNVFYRESNGQVTYELIDYSDVSWYIGRQVGTGVRGNDLGRTLGHLLVEATRLNQVSAKRIIQWMKTLREQYWIESELNRYPEEAKLIDFSILIHFNRYIALNLRDPLAKKMQPASPNDTVEDIQERVLNHWNLALEVFSP